MKKAVYAHSPIEMTLPCAEVKSMALWTIGALVGKTSIVSSYSFSRRNKIAFTNCVATIGKARAMYITILFILTTYNKSAISHSKTGSEIPEPAFGKRLKESYLSIWKVSSNLFGCFSVSTELVETA